MALKKLRGLSLCFAISHSLTACIQTDLEASRSFELTTGVKSKSRRESGFCQRKGVSTWGHRQ
jgi:hypothetical protein